ncbi:MAG: GNAT family N-acetyltransferase [bacterium]
MPSTLTIREAVQTDYQAIHGLFRQVLRGLAKKYPENYKQAGAELALQPQTFVNVLDDPEWAFLLAFRGEKLAGLVQLSVEQESENDYRTQERYGWIEELMVSPNETTEEVAPALIKAAQEWGKKLELPYLDHIIYDFNPGLLKEAAKARFETVSTRVRTRL